MGIISVFIMIIFAIVVSAIALSSEKKNNAQGKNKMK